MNVVGIMNGTSLDGIDFVLTSVSLSQAPRARKNAYAQKLPVQIQYKDHVGVRFSPELQAKLRRAVNHELKVDELAKLHHDLGREYARLLLKIKAKKKWEFQLIGLHGQTVFHGPPQATLQIGEASYLAKELAVPVIADFRPADLAVGGQGAPIASLFHQVAFAHFHKEQRAALALHNIGGISNLTLINKKHEVEKAFDTGPGNMLLDLFVQLKTKNKSQYDKNGAWAAKGIPVQDKVEKLMKSKFFLKRPPKSFGREEFGEFFLNEFLTEMQNFNEEDQLATLVELTARTIALAYNKHVKETPKAILLCGGGSKNKYLRSRIQYHLPKIEVKTTEDYGWPSQAIEGGAFALLAAYKVLGMPSNLPNTTGAKRRVSLGKVIEF